MSAAARQVRTVDGLRGLAALLVVFDHTVGDAWGLGAWSTQNHGITIFAVLTGFLLSSRFLRARLEGRERPATLTFLRDRAARIFPGYWVALAIAAVTIGLHSMGPGDGWRVVTLTQTLGTDTPFEGLPPTWSLSLFLSFYLALPAWAWLRGRADRGITDAGLLLRRELVWLAALIPLAWFVRTASLTDSFAEDPAFTLFGRADWFAIGMILAALMLAYARGLAPGWALAPGRRPGLAFGGALTLTIASALVPLQHEELRDQLDTGAAGLLVAGAVLHGSCLRDSQRLLASRPARALGRWSFGIFLWGYIVMKAIEQLEPGISTGPHLALTLAGAIALGAASWRWVESPAQRWLRRMRHPVASPAPAAAQTSVASG
jgi:peptidoglycan/LPS O-acetylase OafA/YrhL